MKNSNYSLKDQKKLKKGYGSGQGTNYKPWLKFTDFSSKGVSSLRHGVKIDRYYTLFSQLEYYTLRILESNEKVLDIREQFPLLPIQSTLKIAQEAHLKHPIHPRTKIPIVMTSDFLVTLKDKTICYSVKPSKALESKRTLEKLSIEKAYWKKKAISYYVVTEEDIDLILAKNLDFLSHYYYLEDLGELGKDELELKLLSNCFLEKYYNRSGNIYHYIRHFEEEFLLDSGTGMILFYHLLSHKKIIVDLTKPLDLIIRSHNESF